MKIGVDVDGVLRNLFGGVLKIGKWVK